MGEATGRSGRPWARFEREVGAREHKDRLGAEMYVMPENKRSAIVAPMYVVSCSQRSRPTTIRWL